MLRLSLPSRLAPVSFTHNFASNLGNNKKFLSSLMFQQIKMFPKGKSLRTLKKLEGIKKRNACGDFQRESEKPPEGLKPRIIIPPIN